MISAVLFLSFFVFLIMGIPISICLGLSSVCAILYSGTSLTIVATNMYSGISPERAETIKTLAQSTSKLLNYDQSILDIVTGEAQAYFAGQKSADEVARLVQSKVNIYVNEQR